MSSETIRRLRLGDLQKILRHRYRKNGYKVTDNDAGRDDLYQLLPMRAAMTCINCCLSSRWETGTNAK
jgi:hypothetical protein